MRPRGGLAPGVARRAEEVVAMSDHGTAALDLPAGVRAIAARGVLHFERDSARPPITIHGDG